jgi:hypothetical protein
MKKRLTVVLLATLVLAALIGATANAASAQAIVNDANASISQEIDKALDQADRATAVYEASVAALKYAGKSGAVLLKLADSVYDAALDKIGDQLVAKTDKIAQKAIAQCAKLGVTVECRYTPVTLGDHVVYVDPLVIIGH